VEGREGFVNLALLKKNVVTYILIFSFVALLSLAWLSFGRHGLIDLYKMQKEKERCLAILKDLKEKNRLLANEIRRLKEDNKYFESVAREQLGMVKENEIVYRFKKELKSVKKGNKKEK
jgi:cell division protein FtsB